MTPRDTSVPTSDAQEMPAHLWLPKSGRGPGLVMLQEIFGVTAYIKRRAEHLAELGYVVLAPKIYWRSGDVGPFEGADALEVGVAKVGELDWQQAVLDAASAVGHLRELDAVQGPVGIIGFCFGGGLGYNVAAHLESPEGGSAPVDGLVAYYGSALPGLVDIMTVTAPSLHHFGLADQYMDADTVAHMESVLTRQDATTVVTYEGADHAFDNADFPLHHPQAAALAWERTVEWLEKHLPVDGLD